MKKVNFTSETFRLDGGFMIDTVQTDDTYAAYIYHKDYGVKDLMFEVPKSQQSYKYFLELVETNAAEYISHYAEEYMSE